MCGECEKESKEEALFINCCVLAAKRVWMQGAVDPVSVCHMVRCGGEWRVGAEYCGRDRGL